MLIKQPKNVHSQVMQMPGAKDVSMQLMIGREDEAPNFAMRLFTVQPGGHTPLHSHNYEHEVMIVKGEGLAVSGEDGSITTPVKAGDAVLVSPNEMHQFKNNSKDEMKFLCLVPVTFDCGKGEYQITPGS